MTSPERESDTWEKYKTKYLPGDFVQTKFGPAIITKAEYNNWDQYAIWPLPGWKWEETDSGWNPVKWSWYTNEEITLIEQGAASKARHISLGAAGVVL